MYAVKKLLEYFIFKQINSIVLYPSNIRGGG